jgi:hypothetical protein
MSKHESYLNGWLAHKYGIEQSPNPYSESQQPYSYRQWLSGWCDRFSAVKHDLDLFLDSDEGFL